VVAPQELKPQQRPYQPFGSAEQLFYCRDKEVVLSGPAGTGKSRGCLEKLHLCALKYPGMRALIVRKTRTSLTESALVTFEDKVLPEHSRLTEGAQRRLRQSYTYPNGSNIVVGGLDDSQRVMSTEYDMIYVMEAIEATENDWENLTTRLRNGVMPYQQIIADTNPDAPTHWLKARANKGLTTMIDCTHEDNPVLYDRAKSEWTKAGLVYIDTLDRLTGPRKERLRFGKWVQAEGIVYEGFERSKHLVDRFEIPKEWPRDWVIDFGYTNPFVCQFWAEDPDGRLYRYREVYYTQRLVQDHAKQIMELAKVEPPPRRVICDHDAEDRATFERHTGHPTTAAHKTVSDGIQAVATRLKPAGDGKPRLFLLRDSLVERDPKLDDKKLPACTEEEIDGYIWDVSNSRSKGEQPVKANDHGCDAMRYEIAQWDLNYARPSIRRLW
jgi:PBSX family phage terminase large subunit